MFSQIVPLWADAALENFCSFSLHLARLEGDLKQVVKIAIAKY